MKFSFQHSDLQPTGFDLVYMLADADFAVVDADSTAAVDTVVSAGRTARAVFVGASAPTQAAIHLGRPIAPATILKALRQLALEHTAPVLGEADAVTLPSVRTALHSLQGRSPPAPVDIVAAHEEAPARTSLAADTSAVAVSVAVPSATSAPAPEAGPVPVPTPTPATATATTPASRSESTSPAAPTRVATDSPPAASTPSDAKAAKRGAVRRAWLARSKRHRLATSSPASHQVLVLDAEAGQGAPLCELLTRFGFEVTAVGSVSEARKAMTGRFFAVYFLDITLDVGDGVGLLQSIQDQRQPEGQAKPEVLMVVSQLLPADRVRAALAGVGTPLLKPVSRGDLARALEQRGVDLPADARRV